MCYDCQMYAPVKCLAFHGANGIFCNIWLDAIHEKLAQLIYVFFHTRFFHYLRNTECVTEYRHMRLHAAFIWSSSFYIFKYLYDLNLCLQLSEQINVHASF